MRVRQRLVCGELHDSDGVATAGGGGRNLQRETVFAGGEVVPEHDGARVVQTLAVFVVEVHGDGFCVIDDGLDGAGIWASKNKGADGGAFKIKCEFGSGCRSGKDIEGVEPLTFTAGKRFPIRDA